MSVFPACSWCPALFQFYKMLPCLLINQSINKGLITSAQLPQQVAPSAPTRLLKVEKRCFLGRFGLSLVLDDVLASVGGSRPPPPRGSQMTLVTGGSSVEDPHTLKPRRGKVLLT